MQESGWFDKLVRIQIVLALRKLDWVDPHLEQVTNIRVFVDRLPHGRDQANNLLGHVIG